MSTTLGIIIGNRDFFPDHLITEARNEILSIFKNKKINPILLGDSDTKLGGVETFLEAQKCANLFKAHQEEIEGILVILPNFGDEKGVADTIRLSGLNVPVLIQATPDDLDKMQPSNRRDAYCGKISVCNNLYQYGIKFSLTQSHVLSLSSSEFDKELDQFLSVCRVVKGMRRVRIGAVGARPQAFNTVRYSEKILERHGISVTTMDLSEVLGKAKELKDDNKSVKESLAKITGYGDTTSTPSEKLLQLSRLDVVLNEFVETNKLDATAIQCWTSIQENYGCNVCTSMSMMSENMLPSACEVDVTGTLTMYAMQLASNSPSALVDWNNNYEEDEEKCVLFHCGNWAKSFLPDLKISTAPILGSVFGEEKTHGALDGRTPANPLTYGRISTDDNLGKIKCYFGEGDLTDDPLNTFGTRAVAKVPNLQELMRYVCNNGYEHHVVMNASKTKDILHESCSNYLGWDVKIHS
ncbi:L-fucose/L-arabinose isomerase family protein [Alphaproteobacteria bacterium]|nr:L-fucose/L-arabinose isomerase family protein [Alphaproteobacteria bacterium]